MFNPPSWVRAVAGWIEYPLLALTAIWLRLDAAAGRELWFDDVARLRLGKLDWSGVAERLPHLDNFKSPYLVGLHKLWVDAFGHDSLLAIRGYSVVCGVAIVLLAAWVVRRAAGRGPSIAAGVWFAACPFFLRWSVELHQYAMSGVFILIAYALALERERLSAKRFVGVAALAGLGVGTFPLAGFTVLPLLLCPEVHRERRPAVWAGGLLAFLLVVAPAALSIRASVAAYAPAIEEGFGPRWRTYYFSARRTPFEILARLSGLDVRQGRFSPVFLVWTAALGLVGSGLLLGAVRGRPLRDWPWRPLAVIVGGLLPLAILWGISATGKTMLYDRYAVASLVLLPAGAFVLLGLGGADGSIRLRRGLQAALLLLIAVPWARGIAQRIDIGAAYPKDVTSRSYRCSGLATELVGEHGAPDLLLVHGESHVCQFLLRAPELVQSTELRHLTTEAWTDVARRGDLSEITVPAAYGWPFNVAELTGEPLSIARPEAARRVADGASAWVVVEATNPAPNGHLEEEEDEHGMTDAYRAAAGESSPESDAAIESLLRRYLEIPPERRTELHRRDHAVILRIPAAR